MKFQPSCDWDVEGQVVGLSSEKGCMCKRNWGESREKREWETASLDAGQEETW